MHHILMAKTSKMTDTEQKNMNDTEKHKVNDTEENKMNDPEPPKMNNAEQHKMNGAEQNKMSNAEQPQMNNAEQQKIYGIEQNEWIVMQISYHLSQLHKFTLISKSNRHFMSVYNDKIISNENFLFKTIIISDLGTRYFQNFKLMAK